MSNVIRKAIASPDDWVLQIDYRDKKGITTRRVVSPIRVIGNDRMLALCLCREETRQFSLSQCSNITLQPAANVLMPVPMEVIHPAADETKSTIIDAGDASPINNESSTSH